MAQSSTLRRAHPVAASCGGVMAVSSELSLRTLGGGGVLLLVRSWLVLCMGWILLGNKEPGKFFYKQTQ
ncbi:unnamed protein product [Linum tenue]|uniref:Uncharacterized protein n=1 Tax=Linum tenue TaxID=586396 RepID=A0AAV0IHG1_9ROSI|nr:unnamed protein product [Linum tenue]